MSKLCTARATGGLLDRHRLGGFVADQGTGCYHCPGLRAQFPPDLIAR
jgi:hypothetical protein